MNHKIQIGDVVLPCREVVVDDETYLVPKGIGRNNRNGSWQIKIIRHGEIIGSGNYTDANHEGTQGALDAAIQYVVSMGSLEVPKTLKVSNRVSLVWSVTGVNVLGMHAKIYNPYLKRSGTIYMISQSKLANDDHYVEVGAKILKALCREWSEENDSTQVPVTTKIRLTREVGKLIDSKAFNDFVNLGADLASARDSEVI
jgi:hypothetical protein